ncbi:hypothetical protein ACFLTQ_01025 [Chloroflexota bacterium]
MIIPSEETSTVETRHWQANLVKIYDFLFITEPVWVLITVSFVYISIIYNWAPAIPWLCIALSFSPFVLRVIRHGRPSRLTPFDIPIAILLGAIIVGMVVSDHFSTSLGAFQTFLGVTAFYYSVTNYSKLLWLVKIGLLLTVVGAIISLAFVVKWSSEDITIPHGLGIVLAIFAAIALGITVFNKKTIHRVAGGVFGLMSLVVVIFFAHDAFYRLFTLTTIEKRLQLWLDVIKPIEGSSLWTGLGLGGWPLTDTATHGHVHNAYLELYINMGIFGLLALICFLAVGAKLTADILYSPRNSIYYGFGAGVILASLAVLAVSFVESAAIGYGTPHEASYHYIFSPIPFILAGALVVARQLLREGSITGNTESTEVSYK